MAPINLTFHWRQRLYIQFTKYSNHLTSSLTETEPHTAITNQPEEIKERI